MSTVSIIVPVYNAAPYLVQCLDALVEQMQPGWRLIIVDDGSTDGSSDLCQGFCDRATLLRTPHLGQSAARNKGLTYADTDYVTFCDADDMYLPGALSLMVPILDRQSECGIAVGGYTRRYDIRPVELSDAVTITDAVTAITDTLYQKPGYHNSVWATLYRREIFDGIRFAEGRYYEDLEITPRLYRRAGKIAYIRSTVYFYRPNPTSYINTWNESRADAVWATRSILSFVSIHCPDAIAAARSRLFSAAFNIFILAMRNGRADIADECWYIIRQLRSHMLTDRNVRLKNKAGAALSFIGKAACGRLVR